MMHTRSITLQLKSFNLLDLKLSIRKLRRLYRVLCEENFMDMRSQLCLESLSKGDWKFYYSHLRKNVLLCFKRWLQINLNIQLRFDVIILRATLFFSPSLLYRDSLFDYVLAEDLGLISSNSRLVLQRMRNCLRKIDLLSGLFLRAIENTGRSSFGFKVFKVSFLPTRIHKLTVLRSPHVDKKSREQFERRLYSSVISIPFFPILGSTDKTGLYMFDLDRVGCRITQNDYCFCYSNYTTTRLLQ